MPSNSEYPCTHCRQGHCVCYDTDAATAARFARVYQLEVIRCALHPVKEFVCVNDLNRHVARDHAQSVEPQVGVSNGVGERQEPTP